MLLERQRTAAGVVEAEGGREEEEEEVEEEEEEGDEEGERDGKKDNEKRYRPNNKWWRRGNAACRPACHMSMRLTKQDQNNKNQQKKDERKKKKNGLRQQKEEEDQKQQKEEEASDSCAASSPFVVDRFYRVFLPSFVPIGFTPPALYRVLPNLKLKGACPQG